MSCPKFLSLVLESYAKFVPNNKEDEQFIIFLHYCLLKKGCYVLENGKVKNF